MPIRRELRPFYPPNWKELSHRVRFERAGGHCEACGRPHAQLIRCLPDGRWFDPVQHTWRNGRGRLAGWPDLLALIPGRTTRIVLAAAHLDHDPTNNRLRNLKSLCQRCHMIHDAPYHRAQRWMSYRRRYAAGDLFLGFYRPPDAESATATDPPEKEPRVVSAIEVMRALASCRPKEAHNREGGYSRSTRGISVVMSSPDEKTYLASGTTPEFVSPPPLREEPPRSPDLKPRGGVGAAGNVVRAADERRYRRCCAQPSFPPLNH
jgi:hypothetical protein